MRMLAVLALLPLPLVAEERLARSCETGAGGTVEVTLWNPSEHGGPLHCVEAPELAGLFACAPDGGWGLTDPEAPGELLAVATTPAEAAARPGGKFFADVGPSQFVASASRGERLPYALEVAGETFWRMRVTLETGEGLVETRDGEAAIRCRRP